MKRTTRTSRGFTLVELLVVIGIIALLISILLPTLARARDSAKAVKCGSNARQLVQGLIGYSTDFQGTLPLGFAPIGFGPSLASGTATLPGAQRTMEGWIYSVSGYLNPTRQSGMTLPWTVQSLFNTDPNDNYHPVLYCPQVSSDFDDQFTHYGINTTMMPDWYLDTALADLLATSHSPMNMSQMYGDNALLWDGQQLEFVGSGIHRTGGIFLWPSFGFSGVDYSATYWGLSGRDWDRLYRNDEGEDPSLTGDFYRSSEYPVLLPTENLGNYWYGAGFAYLRGQQDLQLPGNSFDSDLAYAPIFRHNGQTRSETAFVDGSVRGLTWNPKEVHPALPGGPYSVGDMDRTMLRPKWPSPLPKPMP